MVLSSIALMVAATALAACGTTETTTSETPKARVVRGPIVADDPVTAPVLAQNAKAATRRSRATMAPIPDPPEPAAAKDDAVPAGAASASSGGSSGGGTPVTAESGASQPSATAPAEAGTADSSTTATAEAPVAPAPTPTPTPSDTLGAPVEPAPTITAEATTPAGDAPAAARPGLPLTIADLRDMMNAPVAGFPLWLMVLVGMVLAAALVFGTGGRAKRARQEPTYEEPSYDERAGEPEAA